MRQAYVDTSCLLAVALGERGATALARRLARFDALVSSNLLEAELRAALTREGIDAATDLLTWVDWVFPERALTAEIGRTLAAGYLRGADLWHVACALYVSQDPADLPFITLDTRQRDVARQLGFPR
ncbi:MAG: PIN domain-containing protein [Gemmatimonadales bacterium]